MGYNVGGGAEPTQVRVGSTAVQKIMVGTAQVWPKPLSPGVQQIASAGVAGTWTCAPGDLLVILHQGTVSAAPVIPAPSTSVPEWQPFISRTAASFNNQNINLSVHYAWATSSSHSLGTWANTSRGWIFVFRNADKTNPFGSGSVRVDSVGGQYYPTAPAITPEVKDSRNIFVHQLGWKHNSSLSWMSQPTGSTQVYSASGSDGWWVGRTVYNVTLPQTNQVSGQLTGAADVASGVTLEIVPQR